MKNYDGEPETQHFGEEEIKPITVCGSCKAYRARIKELEKTIKSGNVAIKELFKELGKKPGDWMKINEGCMQMSAALSSPPVESK